jgi:5-methylcytosine-specific restriction endonuclease McrA
MAYRDPERARAYGREWMRRNPEKAREAMRRWRARHADQHRNANRDYRLRNPGRVKAWDAKYRRAHPDVVKVRWERYRARRRAATGSFSTTEWLALVRRYGGRCAYCGILAGLVVEHRIPLSRGGTNFIDNILPACSSCNARKHRLTEEEFRARAATMVTQRLGSSVVRATDS